VPTVIRDPRISEIFYFFEAYTSVVTGRTVGRKIGIVQEFILKKYLEAVPDLRRRMYLEQFLTGRSWERRFDLAPLRRLEVAPPPSDWRLTV
jgi:hypothetical protein